MTTKHITLKEVFEAAYLLGFKASEEGYNGEYPFDFDDVAVTNSNGYKLEVDMAYQEYIEKLTEANSQ